MRFAKDITIGEIPTASNSNYSALFQTDGQVRKRTLGSIITQDIDAYLSGISVAFPTSIFNIADSSITPSQPNLVVSLRNQLAGTVFAAPETLNGTPSFRKLSDVDLSETTVAFQDDIPDVSNFVPYTGATVNVNLGTRSITSTGGFIGNATTATTLATSRTINGTSFNGSANITTALWGTSRNITIGNTTKAVNGSANVSWSLAEIGLDNYITTETDPIYTTSIPSQVMLKGSIASNDDLNTYTSTGVYGCTTNAVAATLSNSPTVLAFELTVKRLGSSMIFQQMQIHSTRKIFVRNYSGGSWNTWVSFAHTLEIPTSSDYITTNTNQTGLSGNKTTSGVWTFTGSNAVPLMLNRTSPNNIAIGYSSSTSTIYSGIGDSNVYAIGDTTDLRQASNNWRMLINSDGRIFSKTDGDSSQWKQAYDWGDYRQFGLGRVSWGNVNSFEDIDANTGTQLRSVGGELFGITSTHRPVGFIAKGVLSSRWSWIGTTDQGPIRIYATNSTYVDNYVELYHTGNFNPANYLPLSGGTMNNNTVINWGNSGILAINTENRIRMSSFNTFISGSNGSIYLRPTGESVLTNEVTINASGTITTSNHGNSSEWKQAYDWGDHNGRYVGGTTNPLIDPGTYSGAHSELPLGSWVGILSTSATGFPSQATGGIFSFGRTATNISSRIFGSRSNIDGLWYSNGESSVATIWQVASREWVTAQGYSTTDTVTRLRGLTSGTFVSGDITLLAGSNTSISQSGNNITISSTDTNTTYSAGTGLSLTGTTFGQSITTNGTGTFVTGITQTTNGFQVNLGTPPNTTYTGSNGINVNGTVISPTYGTTAGTIAQGNDSRINNGQTAFGWGDFRDYGLGITSTTPATTLTSTTIDDPNLPNGLYHIASAQNTGFSSSADVLVMRSGATGYTTQKMQLINSGDVVKMYLRHYRVSSSTWSSWREVITDENLDSQATSLGFIKSGSLGSYVPTSRTITINGVSQNLSANRSWTVADTVTRLRGTTSGTYTSGDLTLVAGANTTITQSGANITIASTNTNTTYSAGAGLTLSGTQFSLPITYSGTGDYVSAITQTTNGLTVTRSTLPTNHVTTSRSITAGNGLTGGGNLSANRTITMGTPGAITLSSTNSVGTSTHTHAFNPGGTTAQYIRGDGTLATFPSSQDSIFAYSPQGGLYTTAWSSTALGQHSVAIGYTSVVTASSGISVGKGVFTGGAMSQNVGFSSNVNKALSANFGSYNLNNAELGNTFGQGLINQGMGTTVIGKYNQVTDHQPDMNVDEKTAAIQFGVGKDELTRRNAVTIFNDRRMDYDAQRDDTYWNQNTIPDIKWIQENVSGGGGSSSTMDIHPSNPSLTSNNVIGTKLPNISLVRGGISETNTGITVAFELSDGTYDVPDDNTIHSRVVVLYKTKQVLNGVFETDIIDSDVEFTANANLTLYVHGSSSPFNIEWLTPNVAKNTSVGGKHVVKIGRLVSDSNGKVFFEANPQIV